MLATPDLDQPVQVGGVDDIAPAVYLADGRPC